MSKKKLVEQKRLCRLLPLIAAQLDACGLHATARLMLDGPVKNIGFETAETMKKILDAEIKRSTQPCPGGFGCDCCSARCDCGCRNECRKFRGMILAKVQKETFEPATEEAIAG